MSNKTIEDNILTELEQLKGLASRFKTAEEAYQKALSSQEYFKGLESRLKTAEEAYLKSSSSQEQLIDTEALNEKLEQFFLQELVKAKEDIMEERVHWMEKLEARLNAIIKGIEYKFITEGIPFENRQQLIQLKVKQEQDLQRIQIDNKQLRQQITHLEGQTRRNFYLIIGVLALLTLVAFGAEAFKLFAG
ncbi:hypothetical protein [Lewinella cohaerens]|uniref:hypothetical protein n=1 Tax=Lewinella cohaerens TaxID=70995 RepID=UPI0003699EE6|nr:hypothetical protein [Lewinella cohaerens]